MRSFEELINQYSIEVQAVARQARKLLMESLPGIKQAVDATGPYVSYGFGPGYKDIVCYITVSKAGVKLGMAGGATLPDPRGLLEGSGKVHRHIVLKTPSDLRQPGIKPLVRAAAAAWRRNQKRV